MAGQIRAAREIVHEPRTLLPLFRGWVVKLWLARGGGFYGFGYVLVLIGLEIQTLTGDFRASDGVTGFLLGQVIGYLLRISIESFFNGLLALIWPFSLFQWLEIWSVPVLMIGFFAFEAGVRPTVEAWFPELREARLKKARQKQARRERAREKKARKKQAREGF